MTTDLQGVNQDYGGKDLWAVWKRDNLFGLFYP